MKNLVAVICILSISAIPIQKTYAVENSDFWYCTAAAAGFDLASIYAAEACAAAIVAPTPPTVINCLVALGATGVAGGVAYLQCSEFLESQNECSKPGAPDCADSPILLDLGRNNFHLSGGPAIFDLDSDGQIEIVSWVPPGTDDAFLYLDRNGDGVVNSGIELFGTSTLLANGDLAENGYEALAEFDRSANGGLEDGVIDASDSVFSGLRVWIDRNADGEFDYSESMSLAEAGVISISLNYFESPRTDPHGNEFRYMSRATILKDGREHKMWTTDVFLRILAD